jgi:hypothetical protein
MVPVETLGSGFLKNCEAYLSSVREKIISYFALMIEYYSHNSQPIV